MRIAARKPSPADVDAVLAAAGGAPLTYRPVGATREGRPPSGFHVVRASARLGHGDSVFRAAGEHVLGWGLQRDSGLLLRADRDRAVPGALIAFAAAVGPAWVLGSCRVVWSREDDDAIGFGYGSLPGHPESGEESFVVSHRDDAVWLDVLAYSRPGSTLTRLGAPVARSVQRRATERYLVAARDAAGRPRD